MDGTLNEVFSGICYKLINCFMINHLVRVYSMNMREHPVIKEDYRRHSGDRQIEVLNVGKIKFYL